MGKSAISRAPTPGGTPWRSRMARGESVPIAWRQLVSERTKVAVTVLAVAAAVALVLLLSGLRRGMSEQVTLYLDRQPAVLVGQAGTRNFLSQSSVLDRTVEQQVARVDAVADVTPISQQYAMLRLHERRVLSVLIGYDPDRPGGPWRLDSGREPTGEREIVLDRVLASEHGIAIGSELEYRGVPLRVVGLSTGTAGFMTPLAFATRSTVNELSHRPGTSTFLLVEPRPGTSPAALAERIRSDVPGVSALPRTDVARNDRKQFANAFEGPLRAMVTIAFAVAVLVIGLTVYTSTSERGREYATLKTLGLRGRSLFSLVAIQAGVVAVTGTALGVALAFGAVPLVSVLAPRYLISISGGAIAMVIGGALAMALAAAVLPTRYLSRLDPATSLRR